MKYDVVVQESSNPVGAIHIYDVDVKHLLEEGYMFALKPVIRLDGSLGSIEIEKTKKTETPVSIPVNRAKVIFPQCAICQGMRIDPAFANARDAVSEDSYPCHRCHTFHIAEMPCKSEDLERNVDFHKSQFGVVIDPDGVLSNG